MNKDISLPNFKSFSLLDEKSVKIRQTQLKNIYNLDISLDEIINTEGKINDFIKIEGLEGHPLLNEIKHFEQVRKELVENTNPDDNEEVYFNSDNSTIKYNGEIFFIYNKWQGFVLRLLYDRLKEPINIMSSKEIFDAIDDASETGNDTPSGTKLSHLFKGKAGQIAYKAMIVIESTGRYRFNLT